MRTIHLPLDRDNNLVVSGLNAPNPVTALACIQDEVLQLVVHDYKRATTTPAASAFTERPLSFTSLRATIGPVDASPTSGTFRLKVGDQTTAVLTWPTDADALATWKADVLAALTALSTVGAGALKSEDQSDTLPHFFNFAWTDADRTDPIEVVENHLSPRTEATLTAAYPSFQLRLTLFPFAESTSFAAPSAPSASITQTREGSASQNEEQTLIVPLDAIGSLSLAWAGASTRSISTSSTALTASAIQSALNAIVTDGATNPSFRVEERAQAQDARRFAIEFIGPLAAAAQASLAVVMLDQTPRPYVLGTLDLRGNLAIERAINGGKNTLTTFELTIDEDEKYQLPLTIANSLSTPQTPGHISDAGAISVVETTVYVDAGLGEPFITTATGLTFTAPEAGSSFIFSHNFGSRLARARVHRKIALDPEQWRELKPTEFAAVANTDDALTISFPYNLTEDELVAGEWQPLWKGNFRVQIIDPDATLTLYDHEHLWSQCRESLPAGMTVAAKFAALEASLGMLGGALQMPAANITGTLTASQIDLSSLSTALANNSTFSATFLSLLDSSAAVEQLSQTLATSAAFGDALKTQLAVPEVVAGLSDSLLNSSSLLDGLRSLLAGLLQSGSLPANATLLSVPDFAATVPAPDEIPGPLLTKTILAQETTRETIDGKTVETTKLVPTTISQPTTIRLYLPLSPAVTTPNDSGTISGALPDSADIGDVYTVTDSAFSRLSLNGRTRGQSFADGAKITFGASHWYEVTAIGALYFAKECELELARCAASANQFAAANGARFSLDLPLTLALESDPGSVNGRAELVLEIGTRAAYSAGNDVSAIAYTQVFAEELFLSSATLATTINVTIERSASNALTGSTRRFGKTTAFAVSSAAFDLRLRLTKFDVPNAPTTPRGALIVRVTKPLASFIAL